MMHLWALVLYAYMGGMVTVTSIAQMSSEAECTQYLQHIFSSENSLRDAEGLVECRDLAVNPLLLRPSATGLIPGHY